MKARRWFLAVIAVALVIVPGVSEVIGVRAWRPLALAESPKEESSASDRAKRKPSEGTLPKQKPSSGFDRTKVKEAAARVAAETLDELIENLVDDEQVFYDGVITNHAWPQLCWDACLMSRRMWRLLAEVEGLEPAARAKILDRAFDHAIAVHKAAFERVRQSYIDPKSPKNEQSMLATKLGICRALFLAAKCQDRSDLFKKIDAVRTYAREEIKLFEATDFKIAFSPIQAVNDLIRDAVKLTPREDGEPDNAFYLNLALYVCPRDERDALLAASGLERLVVTGTIKVPAWNSKPGAYEFAHSYPPAVVPDVVESITTFAWNGNSTAGTGKQEAAVAKLLDAVRKLPDRPTKVHDRDK